MSTLVDVFNTVCDISWRAVVLIAAFAVLRPFLRKHIPASLLFGVWLVIGVRLLFPFSFPTSWSPFNGLERFRPAAVVSSAAADLLPVPPGSNLETREGSRPPAAVPGTHSLPAINPASQARGISVTQAAAVVWVVGMLGMIALRMAVRRHFQAQLRQTRQPVDARLARIVAECARELGVRGRVDLLSTPLVTTPAVCGGWRPTLLFPQRFAERLSDEELRVVVLHELGHCQRHDLAAHALLGAVEIAHWFNPFVWFATHLARTDCEIACDAFVMRRLNPAAPGLYGTTLLKLAQLPRRHSLAANAIGIVETKNQLQRRIHMIVAYRSSSLGRLLLGGALLASIALVGLTRELSAQTDALPASVTTKAPTGWWKNGSKPDAYQAGVDRQQLRNGQPSAYVKSLEPEIAGFGGMMQMCSAENYLGKRLRLSAWMKTADANNAGAHLWFRIDGANNQMLGFDNMDPRPVKGTTDWTLYSLVLDVPSGASALAYGFFVGGTGQAWVSDFKIEEVGTDVPTTNLSTGRSLPKQPVNLSFD